MRSFWIASAIVLLLTSAFSASAADTIKAVNYEEKLYKGKDPYALYILLRRNGIQGLGIGGKSSEVSLEFCRDVIKDMDAKGNFEQELKALFQALKIPKDWKALNDEKTAAFRKEFPNGAVIETRHYVVLATANRKITEELATKMDKIFEAYDKMFKFEEKIPYKCIIRFWKDRNEFLSHGAPGWAAAYYSPGTKELVGFDTKSSPATSHMDSISTLFHEGWHQFFDFYIPNAPRWFDEGFAEIFSPTQVVGDRISERFNSMRSQSVKIALREGRLFKLRDFIRMGRSEFYGANIDAAYAQAWSFVYYLLSFKHSDPTIEKRVRQFYKDYFWELQKGTDPVDAVDKVFKDVNLEVLEEMWKKAIPNQR
ncbi:MAG: DUF1570 domain-containing protein [Planctomycetota bacterium]